MYTWFELLVGCRSLLVVSSLHNEQLSAGLCHGQGSLLLAGPLSPYPQCHNSLAPSRSGHMCLCRSIPRGDSWYDKREGFPYLHPQSPANKTMSLSKIGNCALQDPLLIVVQCQGNGSSLSSKDGAVIWESLGQLAAGHLTILEMAVDNCCCPHPLVNLRSISIDFHHVVLGIIILSEFDSNLFGKLGVEGHSNSTSISAEVMASSSLRPMGQVGGRVMPPLSFGIERYRSLIVHVGHDVPGCRCKYKFLDINALTASTNVLPEELHWSPCTYWRLG